MGDFAWPFAVAIMVIAFCILFKTQIGGLIARTKKVSRGGIEIDARSQASVTTGHSRAAEKLLRESDSALITEQEEILSRVLDELSLGSDEDRVRYLLRQCTVCAIQREFDHTYYSIFGSQITALQQLNGREHMTPDELKPMFNLAAAEYPDMYEDSSYDAWFGFLANLSLVLKDGDHVRITVRGREFLRYLIAAGFDIRRLG